MNLEPLLPIGLALVLQALCPRVAQAQVSAPAAKPYPAGVPITFFLANDDPPVVYPAGPCAVPYPLDGSLGLGIGCGGGLPPIAPGTVHSWEWDLTTYIPSTGGSGVALDGFYAMGDWAVHIGAADTAIVPIGPPRVGRTRRVEIVSGGEAGFVYLLAGSLSLAAPYRPGVDFPLVNDALFRATLTRPNTFRNFVGFLDQNGKAANAAIVVPPIPALAGMRFWLAFQTFDPVTLAPSRTSAPELVTIRG